MARERRTMRGRALAAQTLLGALVAALVAPAAVADDAPPTIRVRGEGRVSVPAEIATLQLAVVTEDRQSDRAVASNAERSRAVLEALRETLGKEATIETLGFSVQPQYDYGKDRSEGPILRGYVVQNTVQVRTAQLERIGAAIDAGAGAGSNRVESLRFGVRDDAPLRARALANAAIDARAKAESAAAALGVEIRGLVALEEEGVGIQQPVMRMQEMAAKVSTPIEAGAVDATATVVLTVRVAD